MSAPDPPYWSRNSCFGASRSDWVYLAMFHYYTKLGAKQVELVQLMHKFVPWSCFGIFRNECTRSTPLDPKLMYWCISLCLGAFWIVLLLHEAWCKTGWTGAINVKVHTTKLRRKFFKTYTPDPPHWTVNSCFGASRSVWVHFGLYHYCAKLVAKWVELVQLVQKFVPWSRIRIFLQRKHPVHPVGP